MKKIIITLFLISLNSYVLSGEIKNPLPEIVELPEMTVIGYQSIISMNHNLITDLWMRYLAKMGEIQNMSEVRATLGVSYWGEQKGDDYIFFHLVGAPVSDFSTIPQGMTYLIIPTHKYAKFTHVGPVSDIGKTYEYIYGEWLNSGDYMMSEKCFEIEWYDERFNPESPESELDIYIPIE
ncbi:GyrI-like domain-containing protein [candidate division WOR-3 bacterium]|nr:GyrI-like domain-containing protein [candidate division WOR-3 bacterium]